MHLARLSSIALILSLLVAGAFIAGCEKPKPKKPVSSSDPFTKAEIVGTWVVDDISYNNAAHNFIVKREALYDVKFSNRNEAMDELAKEFRKLAPTYTFSDGGSMKGVAGTYTASTNWTIEDGFVVIAGDFTEGRFEYTDGTLTLYTDDTDFRAVRLVRKQAGKK